MQPVLGLTNLISAVIETRREFFGQGKTIEGIGTCGQRGKYKEGAVNGSDKVK